MIPPPKATKTGGFLTEKAALKRNSVYNKNVTKENKLKVVYRLQVVVGFLSWGGALGFKPRRGHF
jgi:hypothetical protein